VFVVEQNFAEFFGEFARDHFGKRHEPSARVGSRGEVPLERSSTVCGADPRLKDEGVAAVESDGWLDGDLSRRVRHEIFGEIPYLAHQLLVF
jgi:hypothetical protein